MKISKAIMIMILLMLISYTVAQVDTAWVRRFNGLGNGADTAWAIAVDDSGMSWLLVARLGREPVMTGLR